MFYVNKKGNLFQIQITIIMDQYVTLVAILDRLIMVAWQIFLYKTKMQ